jgi:site-specific DNA-adenine methylase
MGHFTTVQHCTRLDHRNNGERREYLKIKSVQNKTEIEEERHNRIQWITKDCSNALYSINLKDANTKEDLGKQRICV